MTPIDQIRKALKKLEAAQAAGQWNDIDFAVNEFFNAADRQAIAALLTSHDAAVQRAAEMEADAARYRWLRENADVSFDETQHFPSSSGVWIYSTSPSRRELDGAIDAAIRAIKE